MTIRTESIDVTRLGRERPLMDKFVIQILPDAKRLDITVRWVLDPTQFHERAAIDAFAPDQVLTVRYQSELDLEAERQALASELQKAYRTPGIGAILRGPVLTSLSEHDAAVRKAMMPVAILGRSVYRRLLEPDRLLDFGSNDAALALTALQSALARDHLVVIKSPVSLFPWNFLYDDKKVNKDNLTTLDLTRFWGFRHQIQEDLPGISPRVRIARPPLIVAAVCEHQDTQGKHRDGPLGALDTTQGRVEWINEVEDLRGVLTQFPGDCFYFFGHALQDDPPRPITSALCLKTSNVTVEEICQGKGPRFEKPLVLAFLNGCETRPLNVWDANSLAGLLCLHGDHRVCCVTTFAEVPTAFASHFGHHFWQRFLQGSTLGTALLEARRDLVREFQNPLGLLYTLFGRLETRLS